MVSLRTVTLTTDVECPRCGQPIYIDLVVGPGFSVGTAADGTAEAHVAVHPFSRHHVCKGYERMSADFGSPEGEDR